MHPRSTVYATHGMVAASQPLAAQVGLDVLRRGGNALDAAVATAAALCVMEPCSTGVGGDAFALIWSAADQTLYGLNGSGPAAMALDAAELRARGHNQMPTLGGIAVTVPGAVRAWEAALGRFGSWGLDALLAPAIDYAQGGFPVSPIIAAQWADGAAKMRRTADSARVWLPHGRAPRPGELFRNPEFAATLRALAEHGPDAFYSGPIAEQIAAAVQVDGGALTTADLAAYRAEWVQPIGVDYTNGDGATFTFHELPPNGQGLTALLAFNLLDGRALRQMGWGSAAYWHTLIEAIKLAFADAAAYVADPRFAAAPLSALLSPAYAAERRRLIGPQAARPTAGRPTGGDTVYLTTADRHGNLVSWIQSLYEGFGSGLTAGATGVQLHNRGANFSLEPGHPNEAAGGKRPYHTIIPGFITRDGRAWSSFGVMGGFMQPQGHLQVGLNLVEFGMDAQAALDAPRFNWLEGLTVALETGIAPGVQGALAHRGHVIDPRRSPRLFGGGQVIVRDGETGVLMGGTEPRKDGVVAAF